MLQLETRPEQTEYRLVLLTSGSHATWGERVGSDFRLPRIAVPRWARPAKEIQQAIKGRWGQRAIVLDVLSDPGDSNRCAVVEVPSSDRNIYLEAVGIDALAEGQLAPNEKQVVEAILTGKSGDRKPFARLGWTDEAQNWIQREAGRDVVFTGEISQYNASGNFELARFATIGELAYWMKAAGEPNTHEFPVTVKLAQLVPNCLPPLIASRTDWNAWVTEEIGRPLEEVMTMSAFEQAVHCLGELQTGSLNQIDTLLQCGCFDQRLTILRASLPELIRYLEDAMTRQTSVRVLPVECRRLDELGRLLEQACDCIETLGIPDALIHNDMNSGNILFDGSRAVFIDWAEASVGNPLFAFHHLCAHALLKGPANGSAEHLTNTYKQHWCGLLSESDLDRGLALTPPLAIVSYLCGRDPLFVSEYRRSARCESYARSLARYLDRAVKAPEFMEALCQ